MFSCSVLSIAVWKSSSYPWLQTLSGPKLCKEQNWKPGRGMLSSSGPGLLPFQRQLLLKILGWETPSVIILSRLPFFRMTWLFLNICTADLSFKKCFWVVFFISTATGKCLVFMFGKNWSSFSLDCHWSPILGKYVHFPVNMFLFHLTSQCWDQCLKIMGCHQ